MDYTIGAALLLGMIASMWAARREVTPLQCLIPMCAWCHSVRDDKSYWHRVEDYLSSRSDVSVTHGICPECAAKHAPSHQAEVSLEG